MLVLVIDWQAWVGHARFKQTTIITQIVPLILHGATPSSTVWATGKYSSPHQAYVVLI
jgi:hypothetical protein